MTGLESVAQLHVCSRNELIRLYPFHDATLVNSLSFRGQPTEHNFAESDEIFLLVVSHGGHWVRRRRVECEHVKNAATVQKNSRIQTTGNEDLGRIL